MSTRLACRDCGLACVLMVLKAAGIHTEDLASLRAACSTTRCGLAFTAVPHNKAWAISVASILILLCKGSLACDGHSASNPKNIFC